jgi:hypothetical protein
VTLEEIWQELEVQDPALPGVVRRRLEESSGRDLYAGVRLPGGERLLILEVARDSIDDIELPSTAALHSSIESVGRGRVELRIALVASEMKRVFTPFVEDVVAAVSSTRDDNESVSALLQRFNFWRKLLSGTTDEALNRAEAMGLYSELWVFRHLLVPELGSSRTTLAWQGPQRAYRDYVVGDVGLEVKSTAGSSPSRVVIQDERQLAASPFAALYLVALELDTVEGGVGETLNEMVSATLELVDAESAGDEFRSRLIQYGYLEIHQRNYQRIHYTLRELSIFRVGDDFPRIIESDLRQGISQVRYELTLSSCQAWRIDESELVSGITEAVRGEPT